MAPSSRHQQRESATSTAGATSSEEVQDAQYCWGCRVGVRPVSPTAYALYQHLRRQPEGASLIMEELTRATRSSKTAVRAAFAELEIEGTLNMTRDV